MFGGGPIFGGGGGNDLHEADLTTRTAGGGVEPAFAPDDGFDERGIDGVTARGGEDGNVLAVVAPFVPAPIADGSGEEQEERDCSEGAAVHGSFLMRKS